jgi:hypothetical protein
MNERHPKRSKPTLNYKDLNNYGKLNFASPIDNNFASYKFAPKQRL